MGWICSISMSPLFTHVILVILTIFAYVELTQSCHRRVEYHSYYKKQPHKGHGQGGHRGVYNQGHDGGGYRHHGNHAGGYGHPENHGGDYGHHENGELIIIPSGTGGHGHGYDTAGVYGDSGLGGHEKGHENQGHKGRRYKYQSYEAMHYDDKYGHQPAPAHGYSQNTPHYTQKGYGYSGPYPNTEYSSPVATSLDVPTGISYANIADASAGTGIDNGRPPPPLPTQLDAADTADLIRNAYNTRENEVAVADHGLGNYQGNVGGSVDALPETMADPLAVGNFDLNVNYNSELPTPFRRNSIQLQDRERRKKKISSTYRGVNDDRMSSFVIPRDHEEGDVDASQSKQVPSGPDYLENDAGDVVGANSPGPSENMMNF